MKTLNDLKNYRAKTAGPLRVEGVNVCELAVDNPTAAYDLVFNKMAERGGFQAFHAHQRRQSCIAKAAAKPLPGAAGDAFTQADMRVNGRTVYKVFPIHFRCLQAIDSPLLRLYERALENNQATGDFPESAEWEICFIFTTPPKELRKMLESGGPAAVKAAASEAIDGKWTSAEINTTVLGAIAQISEHAKTTVAFESEAEASSGTSFFAELRETKADISKPAASGK